MLTVTFLAALALGNEVPSARIAPVAHPTYSRAAALATTADGVLLAWSDDRGMVLAHLRSDLQAESVVLLAPNGIDPDLAAGRDGYLLVWHEASSLVALRLDRSGDPLGVPALLTKDGTSAPRVVHAGGDY